MLANAGRAGSLTVGEGLVWMSCADGAWLLRKQRRLGWEFVIESSHGEPAGRYSGRRWLPGGTISLADGSAVDLRRSPAGRWRLQSVEAREPFVAMRVTHPRDGLTIALTIRSRQANVLALPQVVLTACAVVILDRTLYVDAPRGFGDGS